ncbi:plasmid IncI1-type surface exclusion protein ExcA [Pseudomonas syringae]|nr:plasmid IncI1-type surface exclusion protein ExcA [Pseudomonas syringae]MBD8574297.1 plasmid IncI1-type surface exclusion protein ExcA [Pseudomonas syringae]MBD8791794.1 plasmid IncI1-type surface exclusion protein ExcA [Pseudomonas syringae]MBD8801154.1 plasmid IncI1-type surface exclusion protein ExcA [Pseudomonas syringae]MBD8810558.1 plasmid IncI1-type surface exclusion protein ExcA [Pseudomonas syringae]
MTLTFWTLLWLAVPVLVLVLIVCMRARQRRLRSLKDAISTPALFSPDSAHELYREGDGQYFGIDLKNGTVLYIHQVRKGQVDVVGMNSGDWTHHEVDGYRLRLYTKFPQHPYIEFTTAWAQRWFEALGAMKDNPSMTTPPFATYINSRIELLERDNKIHIPRLCTPSTAA